MREEINFGEIRWLKIVFPQYNNVSFFIQFNNISINLRDISQWYLSEFVKLILTYRLLILLFPS